MDASQPIIRTRKRMRRADPSLSRFVDSGSEDRVATRSTTKRLAAVNANRPPSANAKDDLRVQSRSQSPEAEIPTVGDSVRNDLAALDSITSALENSSLSNDALHDAAVLPSQHLGSTPLAGPTTAEALAARRRHKVKVTTYKQHRSLLPTEGENKLSLRSRQVTRSITTPTSTPSCSPAPTHAPAKQRKPRRRQMPLKHRLARVTRSRLPRNASQDTLSQPPISVLMEPVDEDAPPMDFDNASFVAPEDEPVAVMESNIAQRHLTAPQNYTIPDIKDLLGAKSQPFPIVLDDDTDVELQRNPLPQFVLPPNSNLHSPKPRMEPKRGRPGRRDLPRLSFVPLEAHRGQVTGRPTDKRTNQVVRVQRIPLASQAPPASARSDIHTFDTPPPVPPAPRVNFLTPGRNLSPSRIFVRGTPESDDQLLHVYPTVADGPSFLRTSKSSPVRRIHAPSVPSDPASDPAQPPARLYAPMSDLLDDLTRLAKSAAQMNSKASTATPNRLTQKRTHQATLTKDGHLSHMTLETGTPAKVRRLV